MSLTELARGAPTTKREAQVSRASQLVVLSLNGDPPRQDASARLWIEPHSAHGFCRK